MNKTKITMGNKTYDLYTGSFVNNAYKSTWTEFVPGWKDRAGNPVRYADGTFSSDDGSDFAVYDGAQNYLGRVNKVTGAVEYNGAKDDYKESFLLAAKEEICK